MVDILGFKKRQLTISYSFLGGQKTKDPNLLSKAKKFENEQ